MAKATSKNITKRARISKAERLIYDHLNALRVERRLKKTLDQLCKKHPGLEEPRPLLLIHTDKDGRKVYGRWTNEYDRVFISNKKGREEFLEKARAALPEHTKKRIAAGVEAADDRRGRAGAAAVSAFHRITMYTPRTTKEAGLIARYVIKFLPIKAGGTVLGWCPPKDNDKYEEWKSRRHYAFITLETVLRTFAKAAA
jgi:hypothetical protein